MGQMSLYIPDEVEVALKEKASQEHKSTSAYITALVRRELKLEMRPVSKKFLQLAGCCPDFPLAGEELPLRDIPSFSHYKRRRKTK